MLISILTRVESKISCFLFMHQDLQFHNRNYILAEEFVGRKTNIRSVIAKWAGLKVQGKKEEREFE